MKKSRYSEEQMAFALRQAKSVRWSGVLAADSPANFMCGPRVL